jgi:hypothetical protein
MHMRHRMHKKMNFLGMLLDAKPHALGGVLAESSASLGELRLGFGQAQLAGDQAREQGVAQGGEGLGLPPVLAYSLEYRSNNRSKCPQHTRGRNYCTHRRNTVWLNPLMAIGCSGNQLAEPFLE